MTVELNKALFQRFVQFYLFAAALLVPIVFYEVFTPRWAEFDGEFLRLLSDRFGWDNDNPAYWLPLGGLASAHLACAIGLLWTNRWARLGFWISIAAMIVFDLILGPPATYYSGPTMFMTSVGMAVAGAIILTAYARGAGAIWFGDEQSSRK